MPQPALGLVASALVIAISIGYLSLFDFATFVGWVSFFMLCLIPAQIVTVVLSPNPPFAPRRQPSRGLVLLLMTVLAAAVVAPMALYATGEGVSPPGPIPSHYAVIVVPTTFFLAIAFGGWPFTRMSKNGGVIGGATLAASYAITFALFRLLFDYGYMQGAPVYLASAPHGMFNGEMALVFYVTALAGMFALLHFDLWPLTTAPGLMKQPALGVIWLATSIAIGALVMWVAAVQIELRPMYILTRITAPFIFGTIIVLNMLQNSVFSTLGQPLKGVMNVLAAATIGAALAQIFGSVATTIVGTFPPDVPDAYEVWLVNALLSVTFPFLIFHAAYFDYWPLPKASAATATEAART